jgi:ubiquinone/menaquinone biosynthesis C-methylase UbiE
MRLSILSALINALVRSRVVVLIGPRQSAKTTLARKLLKENFVYYFDLEDPANLGRLHEPMKPVDGAFPSVAGKFRSAVPRLPQHTLSLTFHQKIETIARLKGHAAMRKFRRKYYDLFSKFYDRFIALHATHKQGVLREILAQQTGAEPGDMVLDICTGTGAVLHTLAGRVGKAGLVVGLDFSSGMLGAAWTKTRGKVQVCLVQADCGRLPFRRGTFAAVTCSHAFYELKGRTQVDTLAEIKRCLKPGKPFLMMEHEVPENRFVRLLFYVRLMSMGRERALQILKHETAFLKHHFHHVKKSATVTGRSKIYICS